jgi:Uma2 family endonuclease
MRASPEVRYTYEDWLSTPEDLSRRYEIVDGELFVTGVPSLRHQLVVTSLCCLTAGLALEHGLGKVVSYVGVCLNEDTVMVPDLIFVRTERLHIIDWDRDVMGPPDLVAEVLTPSQRELDRTVKRKRYLAGGVAELWILDADENSLEIWHPGAAAPRLHSSGAVEWRVGDQAFEIALADIFRG